MSVQDLPISQIVTNPGARQRAPSHVQRALACGTTCQMDRCCTLIWYAQLNSLTCILQEWIGYVHVYDFIDCDDIRTTERQWTERQYNEALIAQGSVPCLLSLLQIEV